jgi:DtxR family Mn-dependent transcriptional regulator
MRRHDANALSAAAQEYLLALRVMAGDGSRVTAAQVGRHLGVSTQSASEMFRRLASDGLVAQAEGRELVLTPAGRAAADGIFRRHALCEWLLSSIVGLGWADSDEEAARLQGAISPRVEARLDELLGHPETCPHGNPIDAETARRRPAGVRLSEVEAGEGPRFCGSPRRPRRTRACSRTSRRAAFGPAHRSRSSPAPSPSTR